MRESISFSGDMKEWKERRKDWVNSGSNIETIIKWGQRLPNVINYHYQ